MIVTFYSYKGGVGRTQLVANLATFFCFHKGLKILLIDWDLEAPGLHFYFDKPALKSPGIIDILDEYNEISSQLNGNVPVKDLPAFNKEKYCVNLTKSVRNSGVIDLITAGIYDNLFNKRINSFDWFSFFDKFNGINYIEFLKEKLNSFQYDYIFIDSRTGITDYSGITNVQMPEVNVIVTTPNHQNFEGSLKIINGIENSSYIRNGNRKAIIFPLLSKIETSLISKSAEWENKFVSQFDSKVSELRNLIGHFDLRNFIKKTRLIYAKDVSFEETILFSETENDTDDLSQNYINIAENLEIIKEHIEKPDFIKDLVLNFLKSRENASRKEIDNIIISKLSESLTEKQKKDKIKNILQDLSKDGVIKNISTSTKFPVWIFNKM